MQWPFLDPVYTAKSFAAITSLVEFGEMPKGANVCFVYIGRLAALKAYQVYRSEMLGIHDR